MRTQKISFNGLSQPFEQTYTYDDLNRIHSAEEKVNTSTTWKQTFTYDRYGNKSFDANNTTTLGSCAQTVCNPDIITGKNRLAGYGYDEAGNVTADMEGRTFTYDAENHQKQVLNAQSQSLGQYIYDGDGKRVKKISSTETTIFVYDGGGQLVAEYSTNIVPQTEAKISYLTSDHLGSPRVMTDAMGAIIARKDYGAFGDETFTAQRTSTLGYKPENIRQDYTGYQKDDESGLEFAQARYYNSSHGRFTSVDPLTASANVKDPQTFNRYSYVLNSPYKFTDPLGLLPQGRDVKGNSCEMSRSNIGSCTDGSNGRLKDVTGQQTNAPETPPPPAQVIEASSITPTVKLENKYEGNIAGEDVIFTLDEDLQTELQNVANEAEQNQLAYQENQSQAVRALRSEWYYQDQNSINILDDFIFNVLDVPPTFVNSEGAVIPTGVPVASDGIGAGPVGIPSGSTPSFAEGTGSAYARAANSNLMIVTNLKNRGENFEAKKSTVYVNFTKNDGSTGRTVLVAGGISKLHNRAVLKGIETANKRHYKNQ